MKSIGRGDFGSLVANYYNFEKVTLSKKKKKRYEQKALTLNLLSS